MKAVSQKQRESISVASLSVGRSVGVSKHVSATFSRLSLSRRLPGNCSPTEERGTEAKKEGVAGQIVAFKEQHKIREALIAEGRQREVA